MSDTQVESRQVMLPLAEDAIRSLHAGDRVRLSGVLYTARDAAHRRLAETLNRGELLPVDLVGQTIYYVGPTPARPGDVIGSAGPTTSTRMDSFTPALLQAGLKGMIGKGTRSQAVREAIQQHGAVYFVAVGGAAALIARSIKAVEQIAYTDLGTEAIYRLTVEDFPTVVANDIYGGDVYEQGRAAYREIDKLEVGLDANG